MSTTLIAVGMTVGIFVLGVLAGLAGASMLLISWTGWVAIKIGKSTRGAAETALSRPGPPWTSRPRLPGVPWTSTTPLTFPTAPPFPTPLTFQRKDL